MRRAAKIDDSHSEIVSGLRQAGCRVLSLAAIGHGCPDLLALSGGRLYLLEVKNPDMPPSKRRLTADQSTFHSLWPVSVVMNIEQALKAVGATK